MSNKITEVVVVCSVVKTAQTTGKERIIAERLIALGLPVRYVSCEDFYAEQRSREDVMKELRTMVIDELVVESPAQRTSKADRHTYTPPHKVNRNRIRRGKR